MMVRILTIKGIQYDISKLHPKNTYASNGDNTKVEFYKTYVVDPESWTNKKFEQTLTYIRNTNGLVTQIDTTSSIFKNDMSQYTDSFTYYLTGPQGYSVNQESATYLLNLASMYLMGEVGVDDGKLYLRTITGEITGYLRGDKYPLLDNIQATDFTVYGATDDTHSTAIKVALDSILNVTYQT